VRIAKRSAQHLAQQGSYKLFGPGQSLIEPCLAAIRSIYVDDAALGSFIDC
jgi:hypothetical protein